MQDPFAGRSFRIRHAKKKHDRSFFVKRLFYFACLLNKRWGIIGDDGKAEEAPSHRKRCGSLPPGQSDHHLSPGVERRNSRVQSALERIYEAISRMLGPLTELSCKLPILERIAEAIADKRDTADEIVRLYEGETIPFRNYSENLL